MLAPCQGGGQWFWVEDIPLLSVHTGRQRISVSLETEAWKATFKSNQRMTDYYRSVPFTDQRGREKGCKWGNVDYLNRDKRGWRNHLREQRLTITVVAVRRRELDSHDLLQVVRHAHSSEWRGEVDLKGLSLWTIRVIRHLVSSGDVLHHSWGKEENTCLTGSLYTFTLYIQSVWEELLSILRVGQLIIKLKE